MQDLAEAAKRVSEKKRELDELARREKKVEKLRSFLERLDADQQVADSAVSSITFNLVCCSERYKIYGHYAHFWGCKILHALPYFAIKVLASTL